MSTFLVGVGVGVGAVLLWILRIKRDVVAFFEKGLIVVIADIV